MRDYNKIQFRSPSSRRATSTKPSSTPTPSPSKIPSLRNGLKRNQSRTPEKESSGSENDSSPEGAPGLTRSLGSTNSNTGSTSTATTSATTLDGPGTRSPSPPNLAYNSYAPDTIYEDHSRNSSQRNDNRRDEQAAVSSSDALSMRRDGPEATISRLRKTIEELSERDSSSKAALAKSDAVILELRSSVRQLKRQLEKSGMGGVADGQSLASDVEQQKSVVTELQVELDRAHAQLLTADMVRKELEDTLEAEQYTWELRVQDQERTIQQLQQECSVLAEDLSQTRGQWKEAEEGWSRQVRELEEKLESMQKDVVVAKQSRVNSGNSSDEVEVSKLKERIAVMESERNDLQGCLDEALKELEAVDDELQGEGGVSQLRTENERLQMQLKEAIEGQQQQLIEPLHHLYRWVLERDDIEEGIHNNTPRDGRQLIAALQSHLEQQHVAQKGEGNGSDIAETRKQISILESQLSVYRGDLKAREESSAELRASLKEAVSLLKPLQDAVAKAEKEKAKLVEKVEKLEQQQASPRNHEQVTNLRKKLEEKDDEIDRLQEQCESLELQLSRAKLAVANQVVSATKAADAEAAEALAKARDELRSKRSAESGLQQLLKETQSRFSALQKQNEEAEEQKKILQKKIEENSGDELRQEIKSRKAQIAELESECKILRGEVAKKDVELRTLQKEVEENNKNTNDETQSEMIRLADVKMRELRAKLATTQEQLNVKKEVEKALNRSLKEALKLLKPLQMHLEEAEEEKREMAKEMRQMRQRLGDVASRRTSRTSESDIDGHDAEKDTIRDLEETVKYLELENSQLHDALEDMSQLNGSHLSGYAGGNNKGNDNRLREQLVEMKSRYDVTKARLEDSYAENNLLVEDLKKRDEEEKAMVEELQVLREKLKTADTELENAKIIATSALVKVEELTIAERHAHSSDNLYKEKARLVEKEMSSARQKSSVPYRLT